MSTTDPDARDIGLGVAGLGLGSQLLRINKIGGMRLVVRAVYDPDPIRQFQRYDIGIPTRQLADEFGVDCVTDDYQTMLRRKDIQAVAIFSPCPFHAIQIREALLAGKHVLVTKPMVVSLDEAREITSLVAQTGLKLLVSQSMRWNSMFRRIYELIQNGYVGEIGLAEAYYVHDLRPVFDKSPWRYEMPQDLMYGGVCHPVDLLHWFVGPIDEVFAYGGRLGLERRYPANQEMNFAISLKHRSGAIGRIIGGFDLVHPPNLWHSPFHGVGVGLYGTKASIFNDRIVHDYYGRGAPREELIEPKGVSLGHEGEMIDCLRHFEECIISNTRPLVDAWDGARVVAVCHACWESIRTHQPVVVSREFEK